jgi:hypothetical protein
VGTPSGSDSQPNADRLALSDTPNGQDTATDVKVLKLPPVTGGHCLAGRHDRACRRVHRVGRRVDLRAGLSADLWVRLRAYRRTHLRVSGRRRAKPERVTARMSICFITLSYLAEATVLLLLQTQAKRRPSIRKGAFPIIIAKPPAAASQPSGMARSLQEPPT